MLGRKAVESDASVYPVRRTALLDVGLGATGRGANDEIEAYEDVACRLMRIFDAAEHGGHGSGSDLGAVLTDGSEWSGKKVGIANVVDASHFDVAGDRDTERDEGLHETGSGEIVGADDAVGLAAAEHLFDEGDVLEITGNDIAARAVLKGTHGVAVAGGAHHDGGGGVASHSKDDAFGTGLHEMAGEHIAHAMVVDAHEVVVGTVGITLKTAIEQDNGNARLIEHGGNFMVARVLALGELKGCEEDAGDTVCDVLAAEIGHHVDVVAGLAGGVPPGEGVEFCGGGAHDALTDGAEDVGGSEVGNEEAELEGIGTRGKLHIGSGAGASGDEIIALKTLYGLGDGDARGIKTLAEESLAGQAVAGLVDASLDFGQKLLIDEAVAGSWRRRDSRLSSRGVFGGTGCGKLAMRCHAALAIRLNCHGIYSYGHHSP